VRQFLITISTPVTISIILVWSQIDAGSLIQAERNEEALRKNTGKNNARESTLDWSQSNNISCYARKQLLLSARLCHRNSVCPSVTRVDQAKTVQARITKSSPSAAWKTLVSGTVKLSHKFERSHPERGR